MRSFLIAAAALTLLASGAADAKVAITSTRTTSR